MAFSLIRKTAYLVLSAALALPVQLQANGQAGSYLAARQASLNYDFDAAAQYYTRALAKDPSNLQLLENAMLAFLSLGQVDRALPIARKAEADGQNSQLANLIIAAGLVDQGRFDLVLKRVEDGHAVGPLLDGLMVAWAHIGQGDMSRALMAFNEVAKEPGLGSFAQYHKALALASVGDFEGAEAIYANDGNGLVRMSRRGITALAEILSQLDRNNDAVELIDDVFKGELDPSLSDMRTRLVAGETLEFTHVLSARDGMAELFFSIASALENESSADYPLLYARCAEFLRPDHLDALLLTASLLESLGRFELATQTYRRVPADHPSFHAAELGRAEALRRAAKPDAAIEVLEQLSRTHGNLPHVHSALGDLLRQQKEFEGAVAAYDRALDLYTKSDQSQWFLFYARGISHERLGEWPDAEADFRAALELNPDQPQVLNYLGYSMVEKRINFDEALGMIERAVAARPDSGYIVDSLGWVLFRLGRYEEAVDHMERAAELMPVDPVVNDHLGDVYWAVGRKREAEFQWKRALSFVDEETEAEAKPDRIRRKIEIGLDEVLQEEGADPLRVANDDG